MEELRKQIEYTKAYMIKINERTKPKKVIKRGKSGNQIIKERKEAERQEHIRKNKEFKENMTREEKKRYIIEYYTKIRKRTRN
jgi:hypothetical protein